MPPATVPPQQRPAAPPAPSAPSPAPSVVSSAAAAAPAAAAPGRRSGAVALVASLLGFSVITIDVSAVNIALPAIRSSLHGGMTGLQWVVDSYTLMFAALMLSAGALADRAGARRAYAWGVALFTLASLGCAVAPGIGALIGARIVQGAAAAVVMPASLALVRQAYDDARLRARAIALWTVGGSVAMAAGPVLGGVLTEAVDWRAVFLLNLPVGVVILVLLARTARSARRPAPLDLPGQLSAVATLAGLAYAVIEGGHRGWTSGPVLLAAAVAVAGGAAFVTAEKRHAAPMVPLGLLRRRQVTVPLAAGFALNAGFYGVVFLIGLYLQQLRGLSGTAAGLVFVPLAAVTTAMNLISPRLAERFGRRAVIAAGMTLMALAMGVLLALTGTTPVWAVVLLLAPTGVGGALAVPALTALLMEAVPEHRAGTASGLLNALRQTGGALSVALFGMLLQDGGEDFSLSGMRWGLVVVGAVLAVTAVLATRLPRGGARG
ncbi:MFS transporter [Streptomyces mashuensis]|uniref:MFS transporter n=1 Tax=Streptomyces mashuensis TaxID=33904 RepID=A0A919B622_9ACTN|nr:MFS transporter [Streptomyces mashuensis]GHF55057.1 MFS transporter [Streptomyces mashuensis]